MAAAENKRKKSSSPSERVIQEFKGTVHLLSVTVLLYPGNSALTAISIANLVIVQPLNMQRTSGFPL